MAGVTFQLTGHRELDRKFATLVPRIQKKVLRGPLRDAAKVICAQAKANAPVKTERLRKALKVVAGKRSRTRANEVRLVVITGKDFYKGQTFYGAFQEFGWKHGPRRLGNKRKQIPGRHFIEQAYKSKAEQAKAVALAGIAKGIEREAMTLRERLLARVRP